jgi:hypothetical protein
MHHAKKTNWGKGGTAPPFSTSALDGGKWWASSPGRYTPRGKCPCTHWTGGDWVARLCKRNKRCYICMLIVKIIKWNWPSRCHWDTFIFYFHQIWSLRSERSVRMSPPYMPRVNATSETYTLYENVASLKISASYGNAEHFQRGDAVCSRN